MSEADNIAGMTRAQIDAVVHLLANFPADGKPQDRDAAIDATLLGFIERRDITKPCRECGTLRHDYSFSRVTAAGRLFLHFASQPTSTVPTNGGDHG